MNCVICHKEMTPVVADLHRCPVCDLVSSDLASDSAIYDEKYWSHYRALSKTALSDKINGARAKLVHKYTKGPILDFGCGFGSFVSAMAKLNPSVGGFDINPHSGFCSVENLFRIHSGVTFWDSLEHIEDPFPVLAGLDTEYVFICAPNRDNVRSGDLTGWKHYRPNEHIHYFNAKSLAAIFEASGYEVVETNYNESAFRIDGPENILTMVGKRSSIYGGHNMAGSIESGLSSQEAIPTDPAKQGMDTTGADQKPMPTPCESVKKGGKDFEIC